jgi:putative hydrolase of HD superfamily
MVPLLAEYAPAEVDVAKVMKMLLIHDVVEIDAGDTFCFDEEANLDKEEREIRAADRLFGLLPDDQAADVRALWDEFEAGETTEAAFANAMDRLQGLLMNYGNGGGTWLKYGITRAQVLKRMDPIREGAPEIWPFVLEVVDGALAEDTGA